MLLEDARALLETGRVCDHCVGRCFVNRGDDLTNESRGHALRICVAMVDDEAMVPVDPGDCWVCEGLTPDIDEWSQRVMEALDPLAFETFLVGTHVPDTLEDRETELRERAGLEAEAGVSLNADCNRAVGKRLESSLEATVDFDYPDVVAVLNLEEEKVELQINPAYLAGRYRKLEPGIAQRTSICRSCNGRGTQWQEGAARPCPSCGGSGFDTKESVEWYVTEPIRRAMDGHETVFNAAGHESDDVLVTGEGRPFVVEVKEPRDRSPILEDIEAAVADFSDGMVVIDGLAVARRDLVERLTQTQIRQTYRLELTFSDSVSPESFRDAVTDLDSASVHQRLERGDRVAEQIRTTGHVTGDIQEETAATVEVESTDGIDLRALMEGGTERSDPNLADLLDTEVSVNSMAVIAVEGVDAPIVAPEYLVT